MAEIKETKNFNYPRDSACHAKVSIESVSCHCDCGVALPRALFHIMESLLAETTLAETTLLESLLVSTIIVKTMLVETMSEETTLVQLC